jgi:imidazole glycerol-phosphate synthase subunit HisF
MDLLPAIDLRHGRVVRLRQGDDARTTEYASDPLAVAAAFAAAGARRIHVVDLDAALGEPPQRALVERLAAALAAGIDGDGSGERGAAGQRAVEGAERGAGGDRAGRTGGARVGVQLGGGLRDRAAVEWALAAGCERVVLGSLPARDPAAFGELARAFPGRTVPALEVAGGEVMVAGWTQAAGSPLEEICDRLRGLPCPAVLVTDVERDGMLCGPNLDLARRIAAATGLPALLSGGVRSLADLAAAAALPEIAGAILGRALYEGRIDLAAALALGRGAVPSASLWARPWRPGGEGFDASPEGQRERTRALALCSRAPAAGAGPSGLTRRVIPCLDVAAGRVVKGIRFRDLADQGDPADAAARYAAQGADEIVFLDVTAAPEGRDTDLDWVRRTAERVFIPLTVGGGVRSAADAGRVLRAGADKVAVNTAAVRRPELIGELARRFGSQCVVLSVDARRAEGAGAGGWEVVVEGGRTPTGRDALEWIEAGVAAGAGEVLLTSIDRDGTRGGYDLSLIAAAASAVPVPLIASGGAGAAEHLAAALAAGAAAVLAASIFHQGTCTVGEVKRALAAAGFPMREEPA